MDFSIMALETSKNLAQQNFTVLRREGGAWSPIEVDRLTNGLGTDVYFRRSHPEYLILWGEHSREAVLQAMIGGASFVSTILTGIENPDLPFKPPIQQ